MEPQMLVERAVALLEKGRTLSAKNETQLHQADGAMMTARKHVRGVLASVMAGNATETAQAAESLKAAIEAMSFDDQQDEVRDALQAKFGGPNIYVHIKDCYPDSVIYEVEDWSSAAGAMPMPMDDPPEKTYQASYTILDGQVTLGTPVQVEKVVSYVPVVAGQSESVHSAPNTESASVELEGECIPLVEARAIGKDGTAKVRVIAPGWGSSGYYSPSVLESAAPAFKDVSVFWDHPRASDERDRPERSLRDLAGKIVGTPTYEANGTAGPGLYADMQVFKPFRESVEELAPHIGMSIRAMGQARAGEAEGRKGKLIEKITSASSVDVVTSPGAGGQILQLFEAARGRQSTEAAIAAKEKIVTEQEAQALREANAALLADATAATAEIARLRETIVLSAARELVSQKLAESKLPNITRARLAEQLVAKPIVKEGALDTFLFGALIDEAVDRETEYVAALTAGNPIKGLGSAGSGTAPVASLKETWKKLYLKQGHSVEEAERMAASAAG